MTNTPLILYSVASPELTDSIEKQLSTGYELNTGYELKTFLSLTECFAASESDIDLLLCQKELFDSDAAGTLASLKEKFTKARILVLGSSCDMAKQISLLKLGTRGYFDCSQSLDRLVESLICILNGEVWIDRYVIAGLIEELADVPEVSVQQQQALESLSPKELEVAKLVSHGATNKIIANNMSISERTVKAHLTAIFSKMDLSDRLSLAIFFRDLRT